jgi:hypothetical protein
LISAQLKALNRMSIIMDDVKKNIVKRLLWSYYFAALEPIKARCWGTKYVIEHKRLIDEINGYAMSLDIEIDQSKFKSIERNFS